MKTTILAISLVLASAFAAQAQNASTTAAASARIVKAIGITKNQDMSFGNIGVGLGGSVTLPATATPNRTATGAILPNSTGTVTAARFSVSGEENLYYSITVPASVTLTHTSGGHTMTLSSFVTDKTVVSANATYSSNLSASGADNFYVGATITVASNQQPGVYSNATGVEVIVSYN